MNYLKVGIQTCELANLRSCGCFFQKIVENILFIDKSCQKAILPLYKGQTLTDVSKSSGVNSSDFQSLVEGLFRTVAQAFNIPIDLLFSRTNNNINQNINQFLLVGENMFLFLAK